MAGEIELLTKRLLAGVVGYDANGLVGVDATLSITPRPLYWGQAANRCFPPRNVITGATAWARTEDVVFPTDGGFPRVGWARWRMQSNEEVLPAGDGTLIVRMEYPAGVYTYATENINAGAPGSPAAVPHLNNSTLFLNFNKFVPAFAVPMVAPRFRVIQTGNGVLFRQGQIGDQAAPGCFLQNGTGTPAAMDDAAPAGSEYSYPPVAYLVQTRKPSVLEFVDSHGECGNEAGRPPLYSNGLVTPAIAQQFGVISLSESGTGLAQYLAATNKARREELAQYVSDIHCGLGYNDLNAFGRSVAQLVADRATFAARFPNNRVSGATICPTTSTTDAATTLVNQTISANAFKGLVVNENIRAGIPGEAFILDVADGMDPFRLGKFPVDRNFTLASRATACTFTGSISGSTLTVTAISSGTLNRNDPLTDSLTSGTTALSGCTIMEQLTGTTGSTGTYRVSRPQTLTSRTLYAGGFATNDNIHQTKELSEIVMKAIQPAIAINLR